MGALLHSFHLVTFEALGRPRASGPFQYPNIAAMYLEAVAPIAAALGAAAFVARRSRLRLGGFMLVLLLLLDGVLATASRAGLVGALAAVAALAVFYGRRGETRALAPALLATMLALAALASGSELVGRFRFWKDGGWYRAVITRSGGPQGRLPAVLAAGEHGDREPGRSEPGGARLAARSTLPRWRCRTTGWTPTPAPWWCATGSGRFSRGDLYPGGRAQIRAQVRAPSRPGRYVLWWDLVQENTTWFSERGDPGLREPIVVDERRRRGRSRPRQRRWRWGCGRAMPDDDSRGTLWRAAVSAWRAHPLLGIGPDNFRHLSGQFLGLAHTDERMHANSLYFETLADLGMVGVLALLAVAAALAGAARRAVAAPASRILALGVAAGLATYLLHGLLDYFLEFTPTYALFWLLAGMIVAMDRSPESAA